MIDEIFATEAIKDFEKRKKEQGENIFMTLDETEAVISMLCKGNKDFLVLLLNNTDDSNEEVSRIKALFLGRIAVSDIKLNGFGKEDALYHLSRMQSSIAKSVINEIKKM